MMANSRRFSPAIAKASPTRKTSCQASDGDLACTTHVQEIRLMPMPTLPLTLYVDADCPLCAREIHLLQRRADPQRLRLVDISAADFDASAAGLSRTQLGQVLH